MSRFKPLTIHTEAIMIDEVWEEIKKEIKRNRVKTWYIMCPCNIDYFKADFNVQMSKEEISKIMKERYLEMISLGQNLELHVHLSQVIQNISPEEQERLIVGGIRWMGEELNINPTEFVPGWWAYNEDTLKICEKHGLKMIFERDYDYSHDYFAVLKKFHTDNDK